VPFLWYTIGQRRGLGIRLGKPVYVVGIDAENNTVVVGDKKDLLKDTIEVENLNLFLPLEEVKDQTLYGQIRYRTPAKEVERIEETDRGLKVKFKEPFSGVARGQIAALYLDNKILVAGGVIA
jgi:tRNA-specific 2-thiouridylase